MTDIYSLIKLIDLDPIQFCVFFDGKQTNELTSLEFRILSLFKIFEYQSISKEVIQQRIWGRSQSKDKTLNVHFTYLRKKLVPIGLTIRYQKNGTFILSKADSLSAHPKVFEA